MEAFPSNAPPPMGKEVDLCMIVDSNRAGDKQPRRSGIGFMIDMSMSLINWYSKRQFTIETSVFGTEFVAMKVEVETLCHLIQFEDDGYSNIWTLLHLWR